MYINAECIHEALLIDCFLKVYTSRSSSYSLTCGLHTQQSAEVLATRSNETLSDNRLPQLKPLAAAAPQITHLLLLIIVVVAVVVVVVVTAAKSSAIWR
jgi:hypothetical protein